jgi:hypothetical protein
MADQGASQRRGPESTVSLISQPQTLLPVETFGISYFESSLGPSVSNDTSSFGTRPRETAQTQIGVNNEVPGTKGTSYFGDALGPKDGNDMSNEAARAKTQGSLIGLGTPETSAHGTSYTEDALGLTSPIFPIGTGSSVTTYYKLRARDTGASYVEWVTTVTPLTTGSYPGTPVGSLVDLTVLSIVSR